MGKKAAFLLADGEPLAKEVLSKLKKGRFTLVLDGAAERAKREGWKPDLIMGDFDSVRKSTLGFFRKKGVPLLHTPDQNFTDLEKGLAWCSAKGFSSIWVGQGLGKRLDHSLTNLAFLKRFHKPGREILFFTNTEKIYFLSHTKKKFLGKKGRGCGVFPFPRCQISSKGLEFELQQTPLEIGVRESVSNRAKRCSVEILANGECLFIEQWRKE